MDGSQKARIGYVYGGGESGDFNLPADEIIYIDLLVCGILYAEKFLLWASPQKLPDVRIKNALSKAATCIRLIENSSSSEDLSEILKNPDSPDLEASKGLLAEWEKKVCQGIQNWTERSQADPDEEAEIRRFLRDLEKLANKAREQNWPPNKYADPLLDIHDRIKSDHDIRIHHAKMQKKRRNRTKSS